MEFTLFGRCFNCKRYKFFVRKRRITLPLVKTTITSREQFCTPCYKVLQSKIT